MNTIEERLDEVRNLIQEPEFLQGKGLSNEVNIRFFCYDPKDEMAVKHFTNKLAADQTLNCHLQICDLYQVFLEACEEMDILDAIPEMEEEEGSDYLLEQLHSAIGEDSFIEKMQTAPYQEGDVLLLTGIGEVFPFMRVHTLLEALQPYFPETPILVLYPGNFDGRSTRLFNKLKPNDYYRAFNII